jgi:hypothetical protein
LQEFSSCGMRQRLSVLWVVINRPPCDEDFDSASSSESSSFCRLRLDEEAKAGAYVYLAGVFRCLRLTTLQS